jgi:spermidine/putrescine transport system permease protein
MKGTSVKKKKSMWGVLPSVPYIVWMVTFIAIPLGMVAYFALTDAQGHFTLENIARGGEHMSVLLRSIKLAAIATVLCVLIAYPLAYILSRKQGFKKQTLFVMVMLPMWMNFLLRTYAWMTILENNGLINKFLGLFGIGPLQMINTQGAVILGMVYNYIPFMILPLYTTMCKIGNDVIEAAQDLGGSPLQVMARVVIPLSLPGVSTGITMVFVPAISTFIISKMLGGGTNQLIGDIIELQFLGNSYNPNLGSAISLVLMVVVLLCMSIMSNFDDEEMEGRIL